MSIAEIAADKGAEPFDALVDVLLVEELKVSMIVFSMQEDDLREALRHPLTMVGSDGLPPGVGGKPHPRMYGTFPRVLARYCREQRMFPVEEAVRRMTSLPADTFGLADRGSITPGSAADLVALDAATVQDRADYRESTRSPTGIHWIMQGGTVVARDGRYLGPRAGRRLLPAG
jgi:N-acyl-D-aspartate/D-glutamate deacylase